MLQALLLISIFYFVFSRFHRARNPKHPLQLNVYFGVPGSGKTTFAAYLAKQALRESIVIRLCRRFDNPVSRWILRGKHWKRRIDVYSNVPIKGTYKVDCRSDLGNFLLENGKLIIDEAGIEFNNRNYKSFPPAAIKFFKYHRHYGVSVDVFSQSHEDMDVTLRRLAQSFFVVKKSLLPFCVCIKKVYRKVGIDENTHQLCDAYSFGFPLLGTRRIFSPPLWKLFDTYEHDDLPPKSWKTWDSLTDPAPEDPASS